jgi:hypothetical protein
MALNHGVGCAIINEREAPMEFHGAGTARKFVRSHPVIECAQCGERIYVPEWSEFVDGGGVRHLWQCEACDYSFETMVYFAAA